MDTTTKKTAKPLCVGILAHVDAGKTTLSEALLYAAGAIQRLGRVDHRDAYLDTHQLERERGITIFSKQALFETPDLSVTLLDTPGHVDFSAEMERTLQVLDYAILVISATDGVQAHTETLWRLLRRNQIPTFLFVTKMDLPNPGRPALMADLRRRLDEGCVDFTTRDEAWAEAVALREEGVLEQYLDTGELTPRQVSGLVRLEKLFPCFFGSALRLEGVEDFLRGLADFTEAPVYPPDFAARVFKIARDPQGNRLTYVKVTGGTLKVRTPLAYLPAQGEAVEEKVTHLRLYSGARFQAVEEVSAGQVCALLGLSQTYPGQGLGQEPPADQLGRAISDLQAMSGSFDPPESDGAWATLTGAAPVAAMKDYPLEVAAYTRGRGKFSCSLHGYAPCHNQKQVVEAAGYQPESDLVHTPDSVFCAHGGGFTVKWNQVPQYMHLESCLAPKAQAEAPARPRLYTRNLDLDEKELEAIFLREFGPQRRREYQFLNQPAPAPKRTIAPPKQQYLIVDGYNMIFSWDELKNLAKENLDAARQRLMDILSNYCGYKVKGGQGSRFDYHHIQVVYTKQDETGDMYIEKLLHDIGKNYAVRVATSDGLIQLSALRAGVLRLSAQELWREVEWVGQQIAEAVQRLNRKGKAEP